MFRMSVCAAVMGGLLTASPAPAAELKVLTAGAYKSIIVALQPVFEQQTGHKLLVLNGTAGELTKRIEDGEAFDVVIAPPNSVERLAKVGKVVAESRSNLARVGIGVMVKEGMPAPNVSTVEAFKQAVLAARTVAYIDPASGGSSGIYLTALFEKMGIAVQVAPKARLKNGGYVADLIASGEAELGIHQISEILPVKGVVFVGPLPAEIQNYTIYAGGVGATARDPIAAKAFLSMLASDTARTVLQDRGMEEAAPDKTGALPSSSAGQGAAPRH